MANAGDIRMGGAYVEVTADTSKLPQEMKKVEQTVQKGAKEAEQKAKIGFTITAGDAFNAAKKALSVAYDLADAYRESGSEIGKMNRLTGLSTETLSKLKLAFGGLDTVPILSKGMASFMMQLQRGSAELLPVTKAIGLSYRDILALSPEQRFLTLYSRVAAIKDPTVRAGVAMRVFGEGATQILPTLAKGQKYLEKWGEIAEKRNLIFSQEDISKASELTESIKEVDAALDGVKRTLGEKIAPVFSSFAKELREVLPEKTTAKQRLNQFEGKLGNAPKFSAWDLFPPIVALKIAKMAPPLWRASTARMAGAALPGSQINRAYDEEHNRLRNEAIQESLKNGTDPISRISKFAGEKMGGIRPFLISLGRAPLENRLLNLTATPDEYSVASRIFGSPERDARKAAIAEMTPQKLQSALALAESAARGAYGPKSDVQRSFSAIVPQQGGRLLENLGGLGIFSTGDVEKQQLKTQQSSETILKDIRTALQKGTVAKLA